MRYRISFVLGLAIGFVLGTRAGRERYEQMRRQAQRLGENPAFRNVAESAAQNGRQIATRAYDTVNERTGHRLPDAVSDRVHSLADHRANGDDWGTGSA
ncbi:YtxH domain-containing protein [Streptomyces sp. TR06-5]|uniref:YtxH domain-containing protein n=1 Tax=unclassified Streptomyces TaxID=2593676 RepID=UPI00399F60AA